MGNSSGKVRRKSIEKYSHRKKGKYRYHTRLPPGILIKATAIGILLTVGTAFLFYRSFWALFLGIVFIPLSLTRCRTQWDHQRTRQLQQQFISGMQMVSGSLAAGYSMENAWKQMQQELNRLYGAEAEFCREMRRMNQRLAMNESLEQILSDFAGRSGVEDIWNFAEIFRYAKRSGGNLTEIIRTTIMRMQEKSEILSEIDHAVAAKKMEQKMMNILLPGVLLFVTISSPSYVSALYHNSLGILIMTSCLIGYAGCVCWSEHLTDIAV